MSGWMLRATKLAMLATDLGFLAYWIVSIGGLLPAEWANKDYANPILSDWNYSFVVLDLAASVTGLVSLCTGSRPLMLVSLTLTSVAGLQAVTFWALRGDVSLAWWIPNLFLLLFPLPAITRLAREPAR
jgi:hypothetical protein